MATSHSRVWQRATVTESDALTPGIRRIVFEPQRPVKVEAGAHIDVKVTIGGATDSRSYSVVTPSDEGRTITISVLDSPQSRGGAAVMHALRVGDTIEITQPVLDFPLRIGAARYLLLAGGIGITAIAGMASVLRSIGADYTLVYVGRGLGEMAFVEELRREHGQRLVLHVRDDGTPLDVATLVGSVDAGTELYTCGPIRLMDAVRRAWIERELSPANLRFETFGNSGWFDPQRFVVRIPRLGFETMVGTSETMLEALESAGLEVMSDCRKGECGLCEVRVLHLDGDLDHRDVFYSERQKDARGKICCCVSRAVSTDLGRPGPAVVTIDIS
ncbi:PDR/VanB family oxidoreductase [Lacisediminihabitans profunda]|uniref:Oxidoreductase n=1 Tax=Lacisediminihabitans profunda TaxID=2594790 RepID=A0A5C8UNM3_9MICO|nr:PDR/VanB family oxidoreductase [Lacisediminihabitans profunda]TXN29511.1 oxidoreductase [Lacisediminihabitans profunda]